MFNTTQKMIEEQKLNNSTETAILPMQCYVQPFFRLLHKDCFLAIREIESNSIDLIVTDPPYGINFTKGYKSGSTELVHGDDGLLKILEVIENWQKNIV